jgi:hypothetical protein
MLTASDKQVALFVPEEIGKTTIERRQAAFNIVNTRVLKMNNRRHNAFVVIGAVFCWLGQLNTFEKKGNGK